MREPEEITSDLWNDSDFLLKRYREQVHYITDLHFKDLDDTRKKELEDSALYQLSRYEYRIKELALIECLNNPSTPVDIKEFVQKQLNEFKDKSNTQS